MNGSLRGEIKVGKGEPRPDRRRRCAGSGGRGRSARWRRYISSSEGSSLTSCCHGGRARSEGGRRLLDAHKLAMLRKTELTHEMLTDGYDEDESQQKRDEKGDPNSERLA
ncbi:hypothetical protein KCU71_g51, partial [Aureobasidium melanogenum]